MKNNQLPEIRFPEFKDAWELRKFTDIVDRVNLSSNSNQLPKVEFEDIDAGEGRLNKDITDKLDSRKGTIFQPNNILYGKLRPYLKNWLQPSFKGIALGDFWVFEAKNTDAKFDYYLIQADKYQKVANDTSGTKMPRSDWKLVSNTLFFIPKKDEQTKIGEFFKQLDNTIALHQSKLKALKQIKQGFLRKMFPKEGEKSPEIRFPGFIDDWEQRKLGGISQMYQPQTITGTDLLNSGYPVFGANGYIGFYSKFNHEENQITISARGEATGTPSFVNGPVWITGNSMVVNVAESEINKYFLFASLSSRSLKKYVTGGAQPQLTRDVMVKIPVKIPIYPEQKQIGTFFKQLDDIISISQRELEILKNTKKAFLQKMFV